MEATKNNSENASQSWSGKITSIGKVCSTWCAVNLGIGTCLYIASEQAEMTLKHSLMPVLRNAGDVFMCLGLVGEAALFIYAGAKRAFSSGAWGKAKR